MKKEKFYDGKNKKYLYFGIILIIFNIIGAYSSISKNGFPNNIGELIGTFILGLLGIIFIINYFYRNNKTD